MIAKQDIRLQTKTAYLDWKHAITERKKWEDYCQNEKEAVIQARKSFEILDKLQPQENEEAELQEKIKQTKKAFQQHDKFTQIQSDLDSQNILHIFQNILDSFDDDIIQHNQKLKEAKLCFERAYIELDEGLNYLQQQDNEYNDTHELEQWEERLHQLKKIARQYQTFPDQLQDLLHKLKDEVEAYDKAEVSLQKSQKHEALCKENFLQNAQQLSEMRLQARDKLIKHIYTNLKSLRLGKTVFEIHITPLPEARWSEEGIDFVEFCVSTNPGIAPQPLKEVASGGEVSRFMLALRAVITQKLEVQTLIFDEIDLGVGGETATAIGKKLLDIAQFKQVIVVTHSPQVAALGHYHWHILKKYGKQETKSIITSLNIDERCHEIARMISGDKITDDAKKAAKTLLNQGKSNDQTSFSKAS